MKTRAFFYILIPMVLLFATGCSKDNDDPTPEPDPVYDVYVAGYERNGSNDVAMLWKNGKPQTLTDGANHAYAQSVYVSGSSSASGQADVYVSGQEYNGSKYVAKIWKNGNPQTLTDGTNHANAYSVYVAGSSSGSGPADVYAAGFEHNGSNSVAILWKNGVAHTLSDGTNRAEAKSVFVSDKNVYVVGYELKSHISIAKLWILLAVETENGVAQDLTDGTNHAEAHAVYVSDGDIYVAGNESNGSSSVAMLWKNRTPQTLTNGTIHAKAHSVYVSDGDIYVAGYDRASPLNDRARFWKNGTAENLSDLPSIAYSVYATGNDVYVAGFDYNSSSTVAKLWKNGEAQDLTDGTNHALASSVFVVQTNE